MDVCPNKQGHWITPSYVAFCKDRTQLVGNAAKNQSAQNLTNTVFDVKQWIAQKFLDATVQKDKLLFPSNSQMINWKNRLSNLMKRQARSPLEPLHA